MIQKIRIRFLTLAMAAVFVLLGVIVTGMNLINYNSVLRDADIKLEMLSQNRGRFPDFPADRPWPMPSGITVETPYEMRYFSVVLTASGEPRQTDTSRVKAIDRKMAVQYAAQALESGAEKAFLDNYRFAMTREEDNIRIIFLDCSREVFSFRSFQFSSIIMALAGYLCFFFVLLFFSGRITRPMAESYEKQKRFITDAGHEIKTPLSIIRADVDVLEMEYGSNEWLEGIQAQVKRLSDLTNDLVYLSRMEETGEKLRFIRFPFSDVITEGAQAFAALAQAQGKEFRCAVEPMLSLTGNEKAIRQLVNILLDNAMKYSPPQGLVALKAESQGKYLTLSVFNTVSKPIDRQTLPHIFERFYRMDSSRNSATGGYGIGLSVAKAIVTAHGGRITAQSRDGISLEIHVQLPV